MSVLDQFTGLLAPHYCVGCGFTGSLLCDDCALSIEVPEPMCYRCSRSSVLGRTCVDCRRSSSLVSLNASAHYEGVAKELLWRLKFERAQAAAATIGKIMATSYGRYTSDDALIIPVPTARSRVRRRGYDQAVLIAKQYARLTGCEYAPLLERLGSSEQKTASKLERQLQMQHALVVRNPKKVAHRRILLIDDVVTTGATMESAASELKAVGARTVGALVFVQA